MLFQYAQARRENLTFCRSLEEPFGGKSVKISDCRAFSLLETVLACRVFIHSVKGKNKSKGGGKSDTFSMFDEKVIGNARFEPLCFGNITIFY